MITAPAPQTDATEAGDELVGEVGVWLNATPPSLLRGPADAVNQWSRPLTLPSAA